MKGKIDKLDLIKIKNFYSAKDPIKRMKRQATNKQKIFASHISDEGVATGIHKECSKLNSKNPSNPIRKQAKNMSRGFTKEDIQVAHKHTST